MIWLPALLHRISTPPYSRMVLRDCCFHGIFIGHVDRKAEQLAARGGGDLGRCRLRPRLLQIGDHDPGALRGKALGHAAADARSRAGNDCYFSLLSACVTSPCKRNWKHRSCSPIPDTARRGDRDIRDAAVFTAPVMSVGSKVLAMILSGATPCSTQSTTAPKASKCVAPGPPPQCAMPGTMNKRTD